MPKHVTETTLAASVSASSVSGTTGIFQIVTGTTVTGTTGTFQIVTGTTVTGTTGIFQTVTGTTVSGTTGTFTTVTGTGGTFETVTVTGTSGRLIINPSTASSPNPLLVEPSIGIQTVLGGPVRFAIRSDATRSRLVAIEAPGDNSSAKIGLVGRSGSTAEMSVFDLAAGAQGPGIILYDQKPPNGNLDLLSYDTSTAPYTTHLLLNGGVSTASGTVDLGAGGGGTRLAMYSSASSPSLGAFITHGPSSSMTLGCTSGTMVLSASDGVYVSGALTASTMTGTTGIFAVITGTTTTGSTALFATVTGTTMTGTTALFTTVTGATVVSYGQVRSTGTWSGSFAQSLTPNNSATLNAPTGRFVWVANSATFALTSSYVLGPSVIHITKETDDATFLYVRNIVPAAGAALLTPNAAPTANTTCSFVVFNGA